MAVSKFSLIFIALIFASNYSPACGQAVRTPADFWITFGQQLTSNVLNWFLNLDLIPDNLFDDMSDQSVPTPAPTPAPLNPNQLRIAIINGQPVVVSGSGFVPGVPAPSSGFISGVPAPSSGFIPGVPAPSSGFIPGVPAPQPTPAPVDPISQFWQFLWDLHAPQKPNTPTPPPRPIDNYIRPTPPTHPSPCYTTPKCPGGECKPEKVRIVVVDDCKNQKHSSESCSEESSEEIDVIVPKRKHPRRF